MDGTRRHGGRKGRPELTDEQRRALEARGVSVALSAGAGCGKTFALTERFLKAIDPAHADDATTVHWNRVVAITFTDRAAREMRRRIRIGCHERLEYAQQGHVETWLDLIRDLDAARISTIHAFCTTFLRSHAVEAGLDPRFSVLDQTQSDALVAEVIADTVRERLVAQDEDVLDLIVAYDLRGLRDRIGELLSQRTELDFAAWSEATPESLVEMWNRFRDEKAVPLAVKRMAASAQVRSISSILAQTVPENAKMRERRDILLDCLPRLNNHPAPLDLLREIRANATVQHAGAAGAWPTPQIYEDFKSAAADLRIAIDKALDAFDYQDEEALDAATLGLEMLQTTARVAENYEACKRELAAVDFDDLLIHTQRLLTDADRDALRRRAAAQIDLLLVDEFQDTDRLQVALLEALCGDQLEQGKLFFVGDFKQSIYRFRGADPDVFHELRGRIPPHGRLPLTLNFRSQPAILDFVNALFCEEFAEYEPLMANKAQKTAKPAIEWLWTPDNDNEKANVSDRRKREADWIARRLRQLLDEQMPIVWDEAAGKPATRPLKQGDIAILFRALTDVEHYETALRNHGLDYYLVGGRAFYSQQEVFDLLNLLRSVASRCDEVSLAGVLRSPMFSLADETLFWLAQHPDGLAAGLFAAHPPRELDSEQQRRVRFAAETLIELRAAKDRLPVAALIQLALDRTGYDAVLLAEFLGERKLANLRKLIDQARSFDQSGVLTLSDYIAQLSDFVANQPREALAATNPETADVVRLMTIHQAKGLEFPLVVVPDVDRPRRGPRRSAVFHKQLGPLVGVPELRRPGGRSVGLELYSLIEGDPDEEELTRLFYVATTRAADYLILSAGVPQLGATSGPWTELLAKRFDLATGQLRATLPQGWRAPEIKVTTSPPEVRRDRARQHARPKIDEVINEAVRLASAGKGTIPANVGPVAPDRSARRQYSFSRLSGQMEPMERRIVDVESVLGEEPQGVDPRGLGTLVHAVLAEVELRPDADVAAIVDRLALSHVKPSGTESAQAIEMISAFLRSPLAATLASASERYLEVEFLFAWPPDMPKAGGRYLQGYIDCLYRDAAGAWHVVDYKTNRVTEATLAAVAAPYHLQLLVYSLAVEKRFGVPPATLTLHFLRGGLDYQLELTPKLRHELIEEVSRRIDLDTQPQPDMAAV